MRQTNKLIRPLEDRQRVWYLDFGHKFVEPDGTISKGMLPACVEVCPTQARVFGEVRKKASPLQRFLRMNRIGILKPYLNTRPKVFYANLDGEVN